jgi:hypothetical protein
MHQPTRKKPPLHGRGRSDPADAFFPDPGGGPATVSDDLAEELAEGFLASATSAEDQGEARHEQVVEEEVGGPFVPSTAGREFANEVDASNPPRSRRAAFPTTRSSS